MERGVKERERGKRGRDEEKIEKGRIELDSPTTHTHKKSLSLN